MVVPVLLLLTARATILNYRASSLFAPASAAGGRALQNLIREREREGRREREAKRDRRTEGENKNIPEAVSMNASGTETISMTAMKDRLGRGRYFLPSKQKVADRIGSDDKTPRTRTEARAIARAKRRQRQSLGRKERYQTEKNTRSISYPTSTKSTPTLTAPAR